MTPEELFTKTAQRAGVSRHDAQRIVCAAMDLMTALLAQRTRVVLTGFGSFETRVHDSGHAYPAFSAGQLLKDAVKAAPDLPSAPPPAPIPSPVPLTLDPSLLLAWQRRIEQRHQRYQEVREIIARGLEDNARSGRSETSQREIERLDKQIASILATMTERAHKDTTELNAMSRSDLISELVYLRELTSAYDQVTTTGWQAIACLTETVRQSLQQHPELKTALSALHRTLNELSLVADELEAASSALP